MRIPLVLLTALSIARFVAAQDTAKLDQAVQAYVDNGGFMGSVLVARGDQILLSKGYGSANLEWGIPNGPTTKFRLGSLTKQFTAAAVLLLEERGKLKIEDPIRKYLPDAPAAWDRITIFNLLTHTSGIPNFTAFPEYAEREPFPTSPEKLIARFRDKPLEFVPGEGWKYSNSGYIVLGHLIEKLSGQTYAEFVQQNIFAPLGMTSSGYDSNADIIAQRASGYEPAPSGSRHAGYIDMTVPFSAGGLFSTTGDLRRWEEGLFGGKLLSATSLQKMTTPFKHGYAFGVGVATVNGRKLVAHAGGIEGFVTYLAYYPDEHLTVAVLSNRSGSAADAIARTLGSLVHGEAVQLPMKHTAIAIPATTLQKYVGAYEVNPKFVLTVTVENGKLAVQATGQPKFTMLPESDRKFFLEMVDAQIEFELEATGGAKSLTLYQAGHTAPAKRK